MSTLDLDTWRQAREEIQRQRLNATCPLCGANLLDTLKYHAHQTYLESTVLIGCPGCEAEIEFHVEWHVELWSAEISTCHPQPAP